MLPQPVPKQVSHWRNNANISGCNNASISGCSLTESTSPVLQDAVSNQLQTSEYG